MNATIVNLQDVKRQRAIEESTPVDLYELAQSILRGTSPGETKEAAQKVKKMIRLRGVKYRVKYNDIDTKKS